jgi:hypothetical protein
VELANNIRTKTARSYIGSVAVGLAVLVSACGTTTASQSLGEPSDVARESTSSTTKAQISVGSLDYDTAQHMGRLETGVGSSSLDYDTARHMGRLEIGAGSSSLDYDTARHIGRLGTSPLAP